MKLMNLDLRVTKVEKIGRLVEMEAEDDGGTLATRLRWVDMIDGAVEVGQTLHLAVEVDNEAPF